jgi:arginine decarboxylase
MKNLSKHDKDCFNISQLRIITWNRLKTSTQKLVKSKEQSHALKDEVVSVLDNLAVVESYWSFPGKGTVKTLRQMLDRKELTTLNNSVSENIRMLVSESYRDNDSGKKNNQTNSKKEPINNLGGSENYFEVLIVDNLTSKEEEAVKDRFKAIRGSNEKLSYDLLTAGTFQDALIAILFNYNIQACVIRYGVSFKSWIQVINATAFKRREAKFLAQGPKS